MAYMFLFPPIALRACLLTFTRIDLFLFLFFSIRAGQNYVTFLSHGISEHYCFAVIGLGKFTIIRKLVESGSFSSFCKDTGFCSKTQNFLARLEQLETVGQSTSLVRVFFDLFSRPCCMTHPDLSCVHYVRDEKRRGFFFTGRFPASRTKPLNVVFFYFRLFGRCDVNTTTTTTAKKQTNKGKGKALRTFNQSC